MSAGYPEGSYAGAEAGGWELAWGAGVTGMGPAEGDGTETLPPGYVVRLDPAPAPPRATFKVIEEQGPAARLECPRCGCHFRVNAYTGENYFFDWETHCRREACPVCGTIQE